MGNDTASDKGSDKDCNKDKDTTTTLTIGLCTDKTSTEPIHTEGAAGAQNILPLQDFAKLNADSGVVRVKIHKSF